MLLNNDNIAFMKTLVKQANCFASCRGTVRVCNPQTAAMKQFVADDRRRSLQGSAVSFLAQTRYTDSSETYDTSG